MRGCDNFCSFCVVPYTRGRERSRDPGIHSSRSSRRVHPWLQANHAARTERQFLLPRRNGTLPSSSLPWQTRPASIEYGLPLRTRKTFPLALVDAIATHPKICKHIHLPLQAGSDRILELMGRTYTGAEYLALVDRIRSRIPDIVLTTDIICGFCSESEEDFQATHRIIEQDAARLSLHLQVLGTEAYDCGKKICG